MNRHACERCGQPATTTAHTKQGPLQIVKLCAECARIVVRPNTNYTIKK